MLEPCNFVEFPFSRYLGSLRALLRVVGSYGSYGKAVNLRAAKLACSPGKENSVPRSALAWRH